MKEHKGIIFRDLERGNFLNGIEGVIFNGCEFRGFARNCNFFGCVFTNCKFDKDFMFYNCNSLNTVGINGIPRDSYCYHLDADDWSIYTRLLRRQHPPPPSNISFINGITEKAV